MNNRQQKLTLREVVTQTLQENAPQKFTTTQLAQKIFEKFPDWCAEKRANSKKELNDQSLIDQIRRELSITTFNIWQKKDPNLQTLEEKPRKFFYDVFATEEEQEIGDEQNDEFNRIDSAASFNKKQRKSFKDNNINHQEKELYPLLSQYLYTEYNIYSKRIDEKRSSNLRGTGGNKWLFPDVVALEIIGSKWQEDIKECAKEYSAPKGKLWSFEVKKQITPGNVREVFFQTVSNSSWANYAYLVASEIVGSETMKELRILAGLHGIGVIKLDVENPVESQILISANEKNLDWDNASRLAEVNKDFKDYIVDVNSIYKNPRSLERIIKNWLPIY